MTWGNALPVLIVAGIFDLARAFFTMFWFFGPALAAIACTAGANSYLGTSIGTAAGNVVAGVCTAAAGVAGFFGAVPIEMFGMMMSMAFGLAGFIVLGLLLMRNMERMLVANATGIIWMMGSLALSEVPFVGAIPNFTLTLIKLYRTQIRFEKEVYATFVTEQGMALAQNQQQQLQYQQLLVEEQQAAAEQEEMERLAQEERDARTNAALARYQQEEAANDATFTPAEIPQKERLAA